MTHRFQLIRGDIGLTTEWGYPVFKRPTPPWRRYAEAPFEHGLTAELVLIDGRFRVHCALQVISHLEQFEIIFDDYGDRERYSVVEKFAKLERMCGRMAVFKPMTFDRNALNEAIERYWTDHF